MKKIIMLAAIGIGLASSTLAADELPLKVHPDSKNWQNLFAADLSDAIYPKEIWSVKDCELTATEDQAIWTKNKYENFILDLEFKMGDAANSGVIVYCSDLKNWIPNSVEIQILDDNNEKWSKIGKTWTCGGLFGRLAPVKSAVKKAGEWNRMTVACKGQMIYVLLNGELVTSADIKMWTDAKKNPDGSEIPPWLSKPMAELETKGHIGFQGKHGGAPIFFRNMKIKQIE
ncbi:MAG: glycosyl hydrolase [Lentisphaerae bacterium RIFOXYA12_FULL_48_11]|nr:MAG: glycosyl hydrolase [Lentisphaerae bacterium RIFOXYA12_FULL_48_11]